MMESMNESFVNSSVVGRHKDITPEQKDKMAELVASGKSQTEVARMFGICQPTVSRILKSRNARFGIIAPIQQHQRKRQKSLFPRKAVTSVGHQLYTWYTAQKNQGWVVDDQMLLERARELYKLVDPNGREPDQSWLDNWNRCFLASANTNGFNKCKLKSYLLSADSDLMDSSADGESVGSRLYSAVPSPPVYLGGRGAEHSGLFLSSHFASAASSASSNADDSAAGLTAEVLNCTSPTAFILATSVKDEPTSDEADTSSNEVPVEVDRTPAPGISAALDALSVVHRYLLHKGITNMTNFYALENQMLRAELRDKLSHTK